MATFADLFTACYLTGGSGVEFPSVRLHFREADGLCRAFGATALTVGSDIYFRDGAFAPHTPEGLRILAHEVAHVVQQHRGPIAAGPVTGRPVSAPPVAARAVAGGLAVAPAISAEEREAEAAADALLSGRRFAFASASVPSGKSAAPQARVIQRYMAWEHCMLGDLAPPAGQSGAPGSAVHAARAARTGPATRRRGTIARRAPGPPDAAPARQRARGDARGA
jgi:Domain of unknown function (DUF4157)